MKITLPKVLRNYSFVCICMWYYLVTVVTKYYTCCIMFCLCLLSWKTMGCLSVGWKTGGSTNVPLVGRA